MKLTCFCVSMSVPVDRIVGVVTDAVLESLTRFGKQSLATRPTATVPPPSSPSSNGVNKSIGVHSSKGSGTRVTAFQRASALQTTSSTMRSDSTLGRRLSVIAPSTMFKSKRTRRNDSLHTAALLT